MKKVIAKRDWYEIRAKAVQAADPAQQSEVEILIYGDIGDSWYEDSITAAQFVKDLQTVEADLLTVRINSYGGSVSDGVAIYNALKRHPATVSIEIDGVAISIASLIAMAGDTVNIAENALFMVHAPWGYAMGNAVDMREMADVLDKYAQAMATSYASKTGKPVDEIMALLSDGQDHWYTASEAVEAGFADGTSAALPIAAAFNLNRFRNIPAAAAAYNLKELSMPQVTKKPEAAPQSQAAEPVVIPAAPAAAAVTARSAEQSAEIRGAFKPFLAREGVQDLLVDVLADPAVTPEQASQKLLAKLGNGIEPATPRGTHVEVVEDERDKFRHAAAGAILVRAGIDKDGAKTISANPYRGYKLLDFARAALERIGVETRGMSQMEIVAAAFTTSTSDFPVLLETAMHKTLQATYGTTPDTWSRFCAIGNLSDFRPHTRYRTGSFGNLDALNELGEFKNKSVPDGEKASITGGTKGNIVNLSRKSVINDDLGAFLTLTAMLARAAKRTIEADVYALLASNPTLSDGVALFHATHGNLQGTGAVCSVSAFEEGRVNMAKQKDVSGNDYLDLRPALWLGSTAAGGEARVINDMQYEDTSNKFQRPNKVRGLFRDVIDTPRITGTEWYLFADPMEAPVLEVAFLDGNQEPYLELQNGFDVDGAQYKVRLDYGTAAIDYRGAWKNAGA